MAGSPCPIEVMREVIDRMGADRITIAYGQTEASPVVTQTSPTTVSSSRLHRGQGFCPAWRSGWSTRRPASWSARANRASFKLAAPW